MSIMSLNSENNMTSQDAKLHLTLRPQSEFSPWYDLAYVHRLLQNLQDMLRVTMSNPPLNTVNYRLVLMKNNPLPKFLHFEVYVYTDSTSQDVTRDLKMRKKDLIFLTGEQKLPFESREPVSVSLDGKKEFEGLVNGDMQRIFPADLPSDDNQKPITIKITASSSLESQETDITLSEEGMTRQPSRNAIQYNIHVHGKRAIGIQNNMISPNVSAEDLQSSGLQFPPCSEDSSLSTSSCDSSPLSSLNSDDILKMKEVSLAEKDDCPREDTKKAFSSQAMERNELGPSFDDNSMNTGKRSGAPATEECMREGKEAQRSNLENPSSSCTTDSAPKETGEVLTKNPCAQYVDTTLYEESPQNVKPILEPKDGQAVAEEIDEHFEFVDGKDVLDTNRATVASRNDPLSYPEQECAGLDSATTHQNTCLPDCKQTPEYKLDASSILPDLMESDIEELDLMSDVESQQKETNPLEDSGFPTDFDESFITCEEDDLME